MLNGWQDFDATALGAGQQGTPTQLPDTGASGLAGALPLGSLAAIVSLLLAGRYALPTELAV